MRLILSLCAFAASFTAFCQEETTDTLQLSRPGGINEADSLLRPDAASLLETTPGKYVYAGDEALFHPAPATNSSIFVPDLSFYNGSVPIYAWRSGSVLASGGSVQYPGLMQVDSGSLGIQQSAGPFSFYFGATANKYGWYNGLNTQYGINGSIDYRATPWMSVTLYGTYYWGHAPGMANMMPMPPSMLGYYGYNKFGGFVDLHNENVGIQLGGQMVKRTGSSRYEAEPIATPYVKVGRGKKKIGIGLPVGQIIHGLLSR